MENWKFINDNYLISDAGQVLSLITGKIIKQHADNHGYMVVHIRDKNKNKALRTHRVVAISFVQNPKNKPTVNHINGIKTDNRSDNLEWMTIEENNHHAVRSGLNNNIGAKHPKSIPVSQYNTDGSLVFAFESMRQAAKRTGFNQGGISECCSGNIPTYKGFIWKTNCATQ